MSLKTRLEKLDSEISPKQYTLLMIDDMRRYRYLNDYAHVEVINKWHQVTGDFDKVVNGLEAKLRGQKREHINNVIRKARKEASFLYCLVIRVMSSFRNDKYRHCYNGLLLHYTLHKMQMEALHVISKPESDLKELLRRTVEVRAMLDSFSKIAKCHVYHLLLERRMVEDISKRFYDGRELMFDEDREELADLTRVVLGMIETAQDFSAHIRHIETDGKEDEVPALVDIEAIKAEVERDLEKHVQYEIDMARAEVYGNGGDLNKSQAIYQQYSNAVSDGSMPRR